MTRRLFVVTLFVFVSACGGSSPPGPSPSPTTSAEFSGLWSGAIKYTHCEGMRHCFARIGRSDPFTLRLQQSGSHARGVFTVSEYAVELDGSVLKDGTIELTGSAPSASDTYLDAGINVTRFSASISPAVGLSGTLAFALHANQGNSEFQDATLIGDIINTARQDLTGLVASFSGTWKGRFVVRSCTPVGSYCYPDDLGEVSQFNLELAQDGDRVTGTLEIRSARLPVSGRVSGNTLTLEGEVQTLSSGGPSLTRLTAWSSTRDGFGRLQGTFDFTFAWPINAPVLGEAAHAELWQVVKVP